MNGTKHKYSRIVTWLALFSLVVSMVTGIVIGDAASAKTSNSDGKDRQSPNRMSPDLRERGLRAQTRGQDETVKIILQVN